MTGRKYITRFQLHAVFICQFIALQDAYALTLVRNEDRVEGWQSSIELRNAVVEIKKKTIAWVISQENKGSSKAYFLDQKPEELAIEEL